MARPLADRLRHILEIPWRGVADFGKVLRHEYEAVVDERVWQIVTSDLAPLKAAVQAMLEEVEEGSGA